MKKIILVSALLIVTFSYTFFSCIQRSPSREKVIATTLQAQVDTFVAIKNKMLAEAEKPSANEKELQNLFLQERLAYKKFEWASEYFNPAASRFVNGPPVQEIEMSSGQVFEPAGLQVIEGYLFPKYDVSQKPALINQLKLLQTGCDKYKSYFINIDIFNWQVFDATKQEVFRVLTLGIVGFDNPLTLRSSQESITCLESVRNAIALYEDTVGNENLPAKFDTAIKYLQHHTDFNSFDRAEFITKYGNPITIGMSDLEEKLNFKLITYNRLLNQGAKTLFDKNAFNPNAFTPGLDAFATTKRVALGRVLFSDPILSGTGTRSCQSCHQPEKAFADGLVKNTVLGSRQLVRRNTPTLINAALQAAQFYDLRANTLEDQASAVVSNRDEMHGSLHIAAKKLWQNKSYRIMFADAFPKKGRTNIDTLEVTNAIGSYVRSLTYLNSRFDEYMRGNKAAMSQQELNGFNLFMGKAKCGTCHYMPLFNGSFPPRYNIIESEVIGVPENAAQAAIDTDMGRYNILKTPAFKHAFKITSVRNAALTAPYMHNGVFTTLEQVVDFYNKGGGRGLGYKVDNQTLPTGKLNLTLKERSEIVAFIKSLNSKM